MLELANLVSDFFQVIIDEQIEIYNEFSLQHELGIYLRKRIPEYKVQFERNISYFSNENSTIKKEIDISIFSRDMREKYAIELKYPVNGQYPEQMYSFVKDIKFMEELVERGFTQNCCVALVSSRPFYKGINEEGIYRYFRIEHSVYGEVFKPTGADKNKESIMIFGKYDFKWQNLDEKRKYYIIEI